MKATIEYTLPEDEAAYRTAREAAAWRDVVETLDGWLRDKVKYSVDEDASEINALQEARKQLFDLLADYDLKLYE